MLLKYANPNVILNAFLNYPMLAKCCTHHILSDLFTVIYLVKSTNYEGPCLHFALYTCYFVSKVSGISVRTLFNPLWVCTFLRVKDLSLPYKSVKSHVLYEAKLCIILCQRQRPCVTFCKILVFITFNLGCCLLFLQLKDFPCVVTSNPLNLEIKNKISLSAWSVFLLICHLCTREVHILLLSTPS